MRDQRLQQEVPTGPHHKPTNMWAEAASSGAEWCSKLSHSHHHSLPGAHHHAHFQGASVSTSTQLEICSRSQMSDWWLLLTTAISFKEILSIKKSCGHQGDTLRFWDVIRKQEWDPCGQTIWNILKSIKILTKVMILLMHVWGVMTGFWVNTSSCRPWLWLQGQCPDRGQGLGVHVCSQTLAIICDLTCPRSQLHMLRPPPLPWRQG